MTDATTHGSSKSKTTSDVLTSVELVIYTRSLCVTRTHHFFSCGIKAEAMRPPTMPMNLDADSCKQIAALAVVGMGTYALKRMRPSSKQDHYMFVNTPHIRSHPNLSRILSKMEALDQDATLHELVNVIEGILVKAHHGTRTAGSKTSRKTALEANLLIAHARKLFDTVMRLASRSHDEEVIVRCIDFSDEESETFDGILESILHNIMLDSLQ